MLAPTRIFPCFSLRVLFQSARLFDRPVLHAPGCEFAVMLRGRGYGANRGTGLAGAVLGVMRRPHGCDEAPAPPPPLGAACRFSWHTAAQAASPHPGPADRGLLSAPCEPTRPGASPGPCCVLPCCGAPPFAFPAAFPAIAGGGLYAGARAAIPMARACSCHIYMLAMAMHMGWPGPAAAIYMLAMAMHMGWLRPRRAMRLSTCLEAVSQTCASVAS